MPSPATALETLTPFLYPLLHRPSSTTLRLLHRPLRQLHTSRTNLVTSPPPNPSLDDSPATHTNPDPFDYAHAPFTDATTLTLHAGAGGHGCVSFHREKYIEHGPPNGGDGGSGGNIYIQAVPGETSLHKLARRRELRAGRGRNGRGKNQGGERGEDVLITVPVGTVVRELWRVDPVADERARVRALRAARKARRAALGVTGPPAAAPGADEPAHEDEEEDVDMPAWKKERWISYPGIPANRRRYYEPPTAPRRRSTSAQAQQLAAPIRLDLDAAMATPLLLAAGASGGVGNPHFAAPDVPRPKFATRGEPGLRVALALELKMLADVGLVGLPNAGKSTLLRALSASRTRVGAWAFTTLQPVVGTVVLDDLQGRPRVRARDAAGRARAGFSVADIPGLVEGAHRDRGLGLGFLRHVERAKVLAFVVDLGRGGAAAALRALWREVGAYERIKSAEVNALSEARFAGGGEGGMLEGGGQGGAWAAPLVLPPVSAKPWFVVATKADLEGTQAEFEALRGYLADVSAGRAEHPSGNANGWRQDVRVVPVSAMHGQGVDGIPGLVVDLLAA